MSYKPPIFYSSRHAQRIEVQRASKQLTLWYNVFLTVFAGLVWFLTFALM